MVGEGIARHSPMVEEGIARHSPMVEEGIARHSPMVGGAQEPHFCGCPHTADSALVVNAALAGSLLDATLEHGSQPDGWRQAGCGAWVMDPLFSFFFTPAPTVHTKSNWTENLRNESRPQQQRLCCSV
jgi:hypothetical protein